MIYLPIQCFLFGSFVALVSSNDNTVGDDVIVQLLNDYRRSTASIMADEYELCGLG